MRGDNEISYTEKNQQHNICSYGLKLVCNYDVLENTKFTKDVEIYRAVSTTDDVIFKFLCRLIDLNYECDEIYDKYLKKKHNLTNNEEQEFQKAGKRIYRKKLFNEKCAHLQGYYYQGRSQKFSKGV